MEQDLLTKTCVLCGIQKEVSEFHRWNKGVDGYKPRCKCCRSLDYYKNQEQEKTKRRMHYVENSQSYIDRATQWRLKNPEKKQAWNREWAKENKDYYAMYASFRRRGVEQATPKWLTEDDRFLMEEIYHLAKIRRELTGVEWHVDHIIPLKGEIVCGLHTPFNLQVIVGKENKKKSNKWTP